MGEKTAVFSHLAPFLWLSNHQEFICHSSRKSISSVVDCCLLFCVAGFRARQISRLCWCLRGAVGGAEKRLLLGLVAAGVWAESDVTDTEKESIIIPVCLQQWELIVSQTRCSPHLCLNLPLCLIRVQCPPNEYFRFRLSFCFFIFWMSACAHGWEPMGSMGNYLAFPGESLFLLLFVYPQEHTLYWLSCKDSIVHYWSPVLLLK